jgi:hypothetical protein
MERSCLNLVTLGLIDSPLKLHLMLLLYRNPSWVGAAVRLSEWLHESPWSVEEALEGLGDAGLLSRDDARGVIYYRLAHGHEHWAFLERLVSCYEDPLQRDKVYQQVRIADRERLFRACLQEQSLGSTPAPAW